MTRRRAVDPPIEEVRVGTREVYERHAEGWDRHRPRVLFEKVWLDRFLAHIPPGGSILDLGCGAGEPIVGYLLERNLKVIGIDYSEPMLRIAGRRYPGATFLHQDMRSLDLDGSYDGALSWDGSFHLTADEQVSLIADLGRLLAPTAPLMFTVGPDAGETTGVVEGAPVYHASLSPADYRDHLRQSGFNDIMFVAEDPDCDVHSIILAIKKPGHS